MYLLLRCVWPDAPIRLICWVIVLRLQRRCNTEFLCFLDETWSLWLWLFLKCFKADNSKYTIFFLFQKILWCPLMRCVNKILLLAQRWKLKQIVRTLSDVLQEKSARVGEGVTVEKMTGKRFELQFVISMRKIWCFPLIKTNFKSFSFIAQRNILWKERQFRWSSCESIT